MNQSLSTSRNPESSKVFDPRLDQLLDRCSVVTPFFDVLYPQPTSSIKTARAPSSSRCSCTLDQNRKGQNALARVRHHGTPCECQSPKVPHRRARWPSYCGQVYADGHYTGRGAGSPSRTRFSQLLGDFTRRLACQINVSQFISLRALRRCASRTRDGRLSYSIRPPPQV